MIRAVDNKPLELSDEEFEYYTCIINAFGVNVFQDTFEAIEDESSAQHGYITLVKPPMNNSLPVGVVFFLFNVMLNQRIRKFDDMMNRISNAGK